jgi:hypothetical protein
MAEENDEKSIPFYVRLPESVYADLLSEQKRIGVLSGFEPTLSAIVRRFIENGLPSRQRRRKGGRDDQ